MAESQFFPFKLIARRGMIAGLTRQALRARYTGAAGGVAWIVVQPLAMVAIYWIVFSQGMRLQPTSDVPFIVYFVTGLAPWLFFNDAVIHGTGSVVGNPHLVRRIVFPTELLPLAQIVAATVTHGFVLLTTLLIMAAYGLPIRWSFFGVLYYYAAAALLALGLSWLGAGLQVLLRDVGQVMTVLFSFWFWLTPVVWNPSGMSAELAAWLPYNPMSYVVEGYRDSLLRGTWPDMRLFEGVIFWVEAAMMLAVGAMVFRRLKPDFAEVL